MVHPPPPRPPAERRAAGFRVTGAGWCWLLAAVGLWGTALYKAINLVALLASALLALWLLNLAAAWLGPRRLRLRRWVAGPLFARTPFAVEVEVQNPRKLPCFAVSLEDAGPAHRRTWLLARLAGPGRVRFAHRLALARRGWYAWGPFRARSGAPFGLAEATVAVPPPGPLLIYPRLGRLHRGRLRRFLAQAAQTGNISRHGRRHAAAQAEFHGLRPFRSGDSPRWIHWRTSARRGELMVREFEDDDSDNLVVVVDPWLPPGQGAAGGVGRPAPSAVVEDLFGLAATVCWEWCRRHGERLVLAVAGRGGAVVVGGVTGPGLADLALECLAVQPAAPAPDTAALVERLAAAELPPGPVLLLSTRTSRLGDELEARLRRPVAAVDVTADDCDFYEKADDHAP